MKTPAKDAAPLRGLLKIEPGRLRTSSAG